MSTVLHAAADCLYDLAAGVAFDRSQLLASATLLEESAGTEHDEMLAAAAGLRELACSIPGDVNPTDCKRAALLAAYLRQVVEQG